MTRLAELLLPRIVAQYANRVSSRAERGTPRPRGFLAPLGMTHRWVAGASRARQKAGRSHSCGASFLLPESAAAFSRWHSARSFSPSEAAMTAPRNVLAP